MISSRLTSGWAGNAAEKSARVYGWRGVRNTSSLAAVSLQDLGLHRATDLVGGFQAWAAAGLPVTRPAAAGADG